MTNTTLSNQTTRDQLNQWAERALAEAEAARQEQVQSLPETGLDEVSSAYRGSAARILEEIRAARKRLAEGLYGICARCESEIATERLELRPWTVTCTRCA